MALVEIVEKPAAPNDVPEGRAQVLMSATIFAQWAEDKGIEIVEWGVPVADSHGDLYVPILRDKAA